MGPKAQSPDEKVKIEFGHLATCLSSHLAPRTQKEMWILWQDMVQKATKFFSSKKPSFFGHH